MKMKAMLFILLFIPTLSFSKEVALTLDDSPRFATGYFSGKERATRLIKSIKQSKIPPVAFFLC